LLKPSIVQGSFFSQIAGLGLAPKVTVLTANQISSSAMRVSGEFSKLTVIFIIPLPALHKNTRGTAFFRLMGSFLSNASIKLNALKTPME
jgi:hypothetical protein